jgi:hypothetical protein
LHPLRRRVERERRQQGRGGESYERVQRFAVSGRERRTVSRPARRPGAGPG